MYHANKTRRKYKKQYKKGDDSCPFCPPVATNRKIKEFNHFYVIENGVKYDYWEGHRVIEHLLLVPHAHIENLSELDANQRTEMMEIITKYEINGYSVYARGVNSPRRSIKHQHTHIIKIDEKQLRTILFIKKPYFLFKI